MLHSVAVIDPTDRGKILSVSQLDWDALCEFFSSPVAQSKAERPLVVGASFIGGRRLKAECISRTIVPLDFDKGDWDFDRLLEALRERGLSGSALVHTTASHRAEHPRLRAYIELETPADPDNWDRRIKPWQRAWGTQDLNALDITRITYAPMKIAGYQFGKA